MRFFLHTYELESNWDISVAAGVFGAKRNCTGLETKVRRLVPGDVILIRNSEYDFDGINERLRVFPSALRVTGTMIDQSRNASAYPKLLWDDENYHRYVIYPLRVPVQRDDRFNLTGIEWCDLDSLEFRNQSGRLLRGKQQWAQKMMGNFIETPDEIRRFLDLLSKCSAV